MNTRRLLAITSLIALLGLVLITADAWARASGGGSRGSRSFSAPSRPSPATPSTPSSPSRSLSQPAPAPAPMMPQRPSFFGGLMGGIAGFAIGGLLGGLLFGGLGHGMGGLGGLGGFGLMDILLIGGGIVLLVMFLRRRRAESPAPAYAGSGAPASAYGTAEPVGGTATIAPEMPAAVDTDLDRGIGHIRSMDSAFDPAAVADTARRMFQGIQQAVAARDVAWMRDHLAADIYATLQQQCDRLRAERRTNRLEKIEIKSADLTEAWQETGQDFVTVRLAGSMLDYTVDDATGNVTDGSNSTPADFEEYWTLTRPVGPNRWKLSAIQAA